MERTVDEAWQEYIQEIEEKKEYIIEQVRRFGCQEIESVYDALQRRNDCEYLRAVFGD